ncbi:hypothetical protein PB2503_07509 [Parvularcula bermudensis HTCC2503]|uniref:Uncharacterized protein n=1 Tax=Parvularcula bermudensis (strain ATCC BAA-594 / HTCC2503 / KCTC 12087) TaxID=314260 RepID=E0TFW0_PARBH|nr:hypothetical protein [Parvularcula bermudensis]ADM09559.1 hypothetical protein PB2503_07509 [Parvularcula bermudensis HTCC2503]
MSQLSDNVPEHEIEERRQRLMALKSRAAGLNAGGAAPAAAAQPAAAPPPPSAAPSAAQSSGPGGAADAYSGDRSKYFAGVLLKTLRARPEGEENPKMIPGTAFTEYGTKRLLEELETRSDQVGAPGKGMMRRFHEFLTAKPTDGQQAYENVNLEHLERFANFLTKMQQVGWEGVRQDFMQSSEGQGLLEAFAKPRVDKIDEEMKEMKAEIAALREEVNKLKAVR